MFAMRVVIGALALVLAAFPSARAQFNNPSNGVGQATLDAAMATVMAAMPQPANAVPVADANTPAIGAATTRYMLQDSVRPARYRSATCVLSGGTCDITWSAPFSATPNPIGDPAVVNTNLSTVMVQCQWTAISATGATVACKAPLVALTISLGPLTLFPNANNGLVVAGTAVQPL